MISSNMTELAPTRSRTDPQPDRHKKGRSFRSATQSSHHHHRHRHHAKETLQSAVDLKPPISFENILRKDKKDSDSSRRGSSTVQQQQPPLPRAVEKPIRAEDVSQAKKDNERREEDLRDSLKSVEEVGMSSTRQLDDTYYAILEKASILRSTVASLQNLADESKRMHETFIEDTKKLEQDTKNNMQSFGDFQQQDKSINVLVARLEESRNRTNELNDRLESARLRVEAYEAQENDKLARRRTRLNIMWATLIGIVLFVAAVLLARNRRRVGKQLDMVSHHLVSLGDVVDDVVAPISSKLKPSPSEDPFLRKLFDEL
jgi:hypothetical protein